MRRAPRIQGARACRPYNTPYLLAIPSREFDPKAWAMNLYFLIAPTYCRALKCQIFFLYAAFVSILLVLPKKQRDTADSSDGQFYSWWLWTNMLMYVVGGLGLVLSVLGVIALDLSVPTYALEDDRMSRKTGGD